MSTRDLSQARRFSLIVAHIFEAAGRLRRAGGAVAREHGQTQARWQVLSVISEGAWTVPRIAERLGITRQGVQRVADELVDGGLAEYRENTRHANSPYLLATRRGSQILAAITRSARRLDQRLGASVGDHDLDTVYRALERILSVLRSDGA